MTPKRHLGTKNLPAFERVGERVRARKGDRIVIPARALHAEGAVHEETEYLVSARLKPEHNGRLRLGDVLRMHDPSGASRL